MIASAVRRALAGLALTASVGGCFLPSPNDKEAAEDTVRVYHEDIRWSRFSDAMMRIVPALRQRFMDQASALKDDIEFANYELLSVRPAGQGRIDVRTTFEWTSRKTGLLQKTEVLEHWQRIDRVWQLAETRIAGGEKLPFFDVVKADK
jgi:hypothetical protein